jgi:hypothetical protein
MPIVVATVACIVLVLVSELARIAIARMLPESPASRVIAALVGMVAAYGALAALAFAFYRADGVPTANLEVVADSVVEGYPAFGKIQPEDRIIAIDGAPLTKSLSTLVDERNGAPVRLTLVRAGTTRDVTLTPIGHDGHWVLGFRPLIEHARSRDFAVIAQRAAMYPIEETKQLIPSSAEHADPGGPVRITNEYVLQRREPRPEIRALGDSLRFMTYVLLLIVLVDLVRIVRAVTSQ